MRNKGGQEDGNFSTLVSDCGNRFAHHDQKALQTRLGASRIFFAFCAPVLLAQGACIDAPLVLADYKLRERDRCASPIDMLIAKVHNGNGNILNRRRQKI
jgi:hypothetical protein